MALITSKKYEIHYYEVDFQKRALITSLMDFLCDMAIYQGEITGVGIDYGIENKVAWVLYKWDIQIQRYPLYGETITIKTIPWGVNRFYAYRKFEIVDNNGLIIGEASSIWFLI